MLSIVLKRAFLAAFIDALRKVVLVVFVRGLILAAITSPAGFTVMLTTTLPCSCTTHSGLGKLLNDRPERVYKAPFSVLRQIWWYFFYCE